MIKPFLKDITITGNPHVYGKLEFTETEDIGDDFRLSGTACIGTEESYSGDNFDFGIISPKALERELREEKKNVILGTNKFIMNTLDFEIITEEINRILSDIQGETWEEVAQSLSYYFLWEYTDSIRLNEAELLEMVKKESQKESL